jgi:hypothetical protein
MIRIDEVYYNTFLPKVQDKPLHGLHWFDPFGSVKFEDLNSIPAVGWDDQAVRYLFWDQEPLHKELVDQTLSQYKKMYNGTHHIITSEYNSEMVEYVNQQYNFKSHYYFFHGWAALDWFRGYNRSFLMTPIEQRRITNTFICPNRIVGGHRQHRLLMFYHILSNKMMNNYISFPAVCPAEHIAVKDAIKPLAKYYPDIEARYNNPALFLPLEFENESGHPMHSNQLSLFDQSARSLLYLVTETIATGRRQHLTEKTFKPICLKMPFVIVGTCGSLEYLRKYGFKTFDKLWDESYDTEVDDIMRVERVGQLLRDLNNTSVEHKQHLFDQAQEIIEHNYNHFYRGGFEQILWKELTGMIDEAF